MCNCGPYGECAYTLGELQNLAEQHTDFAAAEADNHSIWEHVCLHGAPELIDFCLRHGCPIEGAANGRPTPLMLAATRETADATLLLLERGANPNAAIAGGRTALYESIYSRCTDCFDALIKAGADPNAMLEGNYSILMVAGASGRWAFVKPLIEAGAWAGAISDDGSTAASLMPALGSSLAEYILPAAAQQEACGIGACAAQGKPASGPPSIYPASPNSGHGRA